MEPTALIVAAAPHGLPTGRLASLAARATVVIGVDGGAGACLRAGLVPSVVIGDLDSLPPADQSQLREAGSEFIVAPAHKDETDLDLAVQYASGHGVERLVVTGCATGRLDHTLAALGTLVRAVQFQPIVVEAELDAWILAPGHRSVVDLATAGATFSVVALVNHAEVSVSGATWPLDRTLLAPLCSLGVSNVVAPGGATVTVHSGIVAVLAPTLV